ncbi:MAG: hypothetical protein OMM_03292 [Candidatus Magnetoglobus multicellularis str. Araruama]|uniref:Uncharacterized protein n=1 Tax=Candidatus Magnetoglobus multicellularis str. Araruama TaxID=890399 RepID=A0A1V1P6A3_9BACT|nr:MAG: hypothetical protein OMM_03292 [Candidatus Magnetoglobus multicellularis str. Araruama]
MRGKDIHRYKAEFADLWLIATFPALNLNIDNYPAVKKYLESFGKRIEQTGEAGSRKKTIINGLKHRIKLDIIKNSRKKRLFGLVLE